LKAVKSKSHVKEPIDNPTVPHQIANNVVEETQVDMATILSEVTT